MGKIKRIWQFLIMSIDSVYIYKKMFINDIMELGYFALFEIKKHLTNNNKRLD